MQIKYYNCPEPESFDEALLTAAPAFLTYEPDFAAMEEIAKQFENKSNIIVIGHGGSITSFAGIYNAFREHSSKKAYFISTVDPDYISEVKITAPKETSVVVAISKSGETVTQIEALLQFLDYDMVVITGETGPLAEIANSVGAKIIKHPAIGGRFCGMTEVGLFPAMMCGIDAKSIFIGAKEFYAKFGEANDAYASASILSQLETDPGIIDVFMPVYDSHLYYLSSLIVQLCHESFGKDGKGQTYFAHTAPESQHHTNQRFFGGRKNIAGWFVSSESPLRDLTTKVPDNLKPIIIKNGSLSVLDGLPLESALHFEREGTIEDAKQAGIPVVDQTIEQRSPNEIGRLIAFWQLYAIYSSLMRKVDPFDQPQVENSKKISFSKRQSHSSLK